eukprot:scaffold45142_cov19-Prasinocladus_malaysianus.AAC.2
MHCHIGYITSAVNSNAVRGVMSPPLRSPDQTAKASVPLACSPLTSVVCKFVHFMAGQQTRRHKFCHTNSVLD